MTFFTTHQPHFRCALALLISICSACANAGESPSATQTATLLRIRDAAMQSDFAYERLTDLTDRIGPRLSGSPGAEAAVEQVASALRAAGLQVSLQPVKAPHWVRGVETAELVGYPGRPGNLTQRVALTALGGSSATPAAGLTAPVVVVHSFDELEARAGQIKGSIVLYDVAYDQTLADNGNAGAAYGQAGKYRFVGPARAARLGALAALVRSVGGANFRLPHTGATNWEAAGRHIPAAAVSAEDAMLITRLSAKGPVSMHLTLTPQTLPDVDSHNVIADLPGRDKADQIVIISGHLDSWDLGQGAIDDGAGVAVSMGVVELFKRLGLQPRRTVRMVAWMNEENGQRGAKAYFERNKANLAQHVAAIETDSGAGRPLGVLTSVALPDLKLLEPLMPSLQSFGAGILQRREALDTGDLSLLEEAGVPSFEPLVDNRTYFHYHHTAADTLDKVDPDSLRRQVAALAMLTWMLAEMPETLARLPVAAH